MSRSVVGWTCCVLGCLAATAQGQTSTQLGLSFSQGGGWSYAPRQHQVIVPGYPANVVPGYYPSYPVWNYGGYPTTLGTYTYPGYYWPYPLSMSSMPGSPLNPPVTALPAQRGEFGEIQIAKNDPAKRPIEQSLAGARAKALDYMAKGDQQLRKQNWQQTYANYRQAASLGDDLAVAHLRYGIILAMTSRYDRAAMEFRRAVYVDPNLPTSGFTLESLFGPDSQLVRSSIISRLRVWVDEDVADPARLFVLGVILHFNGDERAQTLFSAAVRLTNGASHVAAFVPKVPVKSKDAPPQPKLDVDGLPPAPVPALPPKPDDSLDPIPPRPKSGSGFLPPSQAPKTAIPKPSPKDSDGPLLLPPLPK